MVVFYKMRNMLVLFYDKYSYVVGFFYKENLGIIYGHYPAPLDEVGHDGHVGFQTMGFTYPEVHDQVSKNYVWDITWGFLEDGKACGW